MDISTNMAWAMVKDSFRDGTFLVDKFLKAAENRGLLARKTTRDDLGIYLAHQLITGAFWQEVVQALLESPDKTPGHEALRRGVVVALERAEKIGLADGFRDTRPEEV